MLSRHEREAAAETLTAEVVRQLLRYEPDTGRLFWRERPRELCGSDRYHRTWNTRNAGREAFTATKGDGYRHGSLFGRLFQAHRVIWLLVHGRWPSALIDHRNGARTDNRIENLQEASDAKNARNQRQRSDNTSGVTGVSFSRQKRKWRAGIMINGQTKHLGHFDNLDAAAAARDAANRQYGFSERHGKASA